MSILLSELTFNLAQMIQELGQTVTVRNVTTLSGTPPYPNPPTVNTVVVNGATSAGAKSINFRGALVNGRLVPADSFAIGTDPTTYTVTAQTLSGSNQLAGVQFAPGLAQNVADGTNVAFTFTADAPIQALVTSYPARLINNTSIQLTDRQVRFLASTVAWTPVDTDKIFIGGDQYSIITVRALEVQGAVYGYSCQARR